jgi:hypothetical protein
MPPHINTYLIQARQQDLARAAARARLLHDAKSDRPRPSRPRARPAARLRVPAFFTSLTVRRA